MFFELIKYLQHNLEFLLMIKFLLKSSTRTVRSFCNRKQALKPKYLAVLLSGICNLSFANQCIPNLGGILPKEAEQLSALQTSTLNKMANYQLGDGIPEEWNTPLSIKEGEAFSGTKLNLNQPAFSETLHVEEVSAGRIARSLGRVVRAGEGAAEILGPVADLVAIGLWSYSIASTFSSESATAFDKATSVLSIIPIVGDIMGTLQDPIDQIIIHNRIASFEQGNLYQYGHLNAGQIKDEKGKRDVYTHYEQYLGGLRELAESIIDDEIAKSHSIFYSFKQAKEHLLHEAFGKMDQELYKNIITHWHQNGVNYSPQTSPCVTETRQLNSSLQSEASSVIKGAGAALLNCQKNELLTRLNTFDNWLTQPSLKEGLSKLLAAKERMMSQAESNLEKVSNDLKLELATKVVERINTFLALDSITQQTTRLYNAAKTFAFDEWVREYQKDGIEVVSINSNGGYLEEQLYTYVQPKACSVVMGCPLPYEKKDGTRKIHFDETKDTTLIKISKHPQISDLNLNIPTYINHRLNSGWTSRELKGELVRYIDAYQKAYQSFSQGLAKRNQLKSMYSITTIPKDGIIFILTPTDPSFVIKPIQILTSTEIDEFEKANKAIHEGVLAPYSRLPIANLKNNASYIWGELNRLWKVKVEQEKNTEWVAQELAFVTLQEGKKLLKLHKDHAKATQTLGYFARWAAYQHLTFRTLKDTHEVGSESVNLLLNPNMGSDFSELKETVGDLSHSISSLNHQSIDIAYPENIDTAFDKMTWLFKQPEISAIQKVHGLHANLNTIESFDICSDTLKPATNLIYTLIDNQYILSLGLQSIFLDMDQFSYELDELVKKAQDRIKTDLVCTQ